MAKEYGITDKNLKTMDKYIIEKAWHWTKDSQVRITSKNLEYVETCLGNGLQCNGNNIDKIMKRLEKVACLIKEIDFLNKEKHPF
jgi:hypothetical protein